MSKYKSHRFRVVELGSGEFVVQWQNGWCHPESDKWRVTEENQFFHTQRSAEITMEEYAYMTWLQDEKLSLEHKREQVVRVVARCN